MSDLIMTQEEKARAYDEAIKRAIKHHDKDGLTLEQYETIDIIFPELKESKDENIKKEIIDYIKTGTYHKDWIAWLEKQGKQKPNPYSGTSFEYNGHTWGMCARDNGVEILFDGELKAFLSSEKSFIYPTHPQPVLEPIKEENIGNSNKVKPKFKVGDWITDGEKVWKIGYIEDGMYIEHRGSISAGGTIESIDRHYHLWTIQDAKDGDVLVASDGSIFIFNSLDNKGCKFYVALTVSNKLVINRKKLKYYLETSTAVNPATKTQRDILAKAMLSLGYTFDFDKKELNKSNSYCQEHCKGFQETGKCFADGDCKDKREAERKSTWSEDDDYKLNMCITAIEACYYKWDSLVNWLKSLKERIGG